MKAEREPVVRKLKIARGQIDGILRMIDDNRYCIDIATQLLATQSILKGVTRDILEAHVRSCVKQALESENSKDKLDEALATIEKMMDS